MERSLICPGCLSRYEDIRGLIYVVGVAVGTRCENDWHLGATYNPNRWELSEFDREFLDEQHVSQR